MTRITHLGDPTRQPLDVIGLDVVERCLENDGTATIDELYPAGVVAA